MSGAAATQHDLRRRLAIRVRRARKAVGLTLKGAAGCVNMHWRHWQKIEAAEVNVTLHTLVRMAEVLHVDPADLIREPPPEPAKKK